MAHLIDESKGYAAFVSYEQPAWHGLGKVLHNPISARMALEQGGLDYTVIKLPNIHAIPVYGNGFDQPPTDFIEEVSDDSFFTYRRDTNKKLGTKLGKDYQVLQNVEALDVVDEILQNGTATIETAGAIDGGRKVFILLKVKKDIIVGSNDVVHQYWLIVTSHDGSLSITAMGTNVRVVCHNTLTAALQGAQSKVKIRHTKNAKEKLAEAAKVLRLIQQNTEVNEANYNQMKATKITQQEMWNYFGNIFLTPQEISRLQAGERAKEVLKEGKIETIDKVLDFALNGVGHSMAMAGTEHTMWSAYNGVTGYLTRKKYENDNARANSMLFGNTAEKIEKAGVLALNKAKIQPLHRTNLNNINLN